MNMSGSYTLLTKFMSNCPSQYVCARRHSFQVRKEDISLSDCSKKNAKRSIVFSLLLYFILLTSFVCASDVTVSVQAVPKLITVGDPVELTVTINQEEGARIITPDLDAYLTDFEILDRDVVEKKHDKTSETQLRYRVTVFEPKNTPVPEITINYTASDGTQKSVLSDAFDIVVTSVLEQGLESYDIKDVKGPFLLYHSIVWLVLLGILFLGAVIFSAIVFIKRYRRRKLLSVDDETSLLSPEEKALSRLSKLEEADLLAAGQVKRFYIILSDIIRQYLQERCEFNALDQTTKEILRELRNRKLKGNNIEVVKTLFTDSDLVKFAKYFPELHTTRDNMDEARKIVDIFAPTEDSGGD